MAVKNLAALLNFVGGEISPQIAARTDIELLNKSLARCENFICLPQGGSAYRPGTYNVGMTKLNSSAFLIPFQFSAADALMIVASNRVFRFYRNDAVVLNTAVSIIQITQANPALVYAPGHGFVNGTEVYISGVGGMNQLNGRFFIVANAVNKATTISAITKANPGVFTANGHGLSNGQYVTISGAAGMTQVNGNWIVQNATTNTFTVESLTGVPLNTTSDPTYTANSASVDGSNFTLQDQFANNINSTAYGAFTSGGTVASIYELATPYNTADLSFIRTAQSADVMYLTCYNEVVGNSYNPRKLVRNGFTNWTLNTYKRKNDPFPSVAHTSFTPTKITKAVGCTVTVSSTNGLSAGDIVYALNIGGMIELDGQFFQVGAVTAKTFELLDSDGNPVDSTGFTTFTSGGTFTRHLRDPACCGYSADGRLCLAATEQNPEGFWGSRTPKGILTRYDDYTISSKSSSTDPTLAMAFSFSPVNNTIDMIREMVQFSGMFALLGASSIRLVYGAQQGQPATPIAINVLPTIQGAARVKPLVINWDLIFVDVNGQRLRGLQYNLAYQTFQANDYNLSSPHFGQESPFIKLAYVKGTPEMVYVLRQDGIVLAFTFNNIENIAGWSRIIPGGGGQVLDIGTIRKSNGTDELWMIVQRTLNGQTFTTVEVMDVQPIIPSRDSFFTGGYKINPDTAKATDDANWQAAAWEALKATTFLDCSLTYDGTARGAAAGANITITGDATTAGNTVTLTASASVFQASDVGSQFWKYYTSTGAGGGRLQITGYTSGTSVQAYVKAPFDNNNAINAGSWAFAVNQLFGLDWYNNSQVNIQADGGGQPAQTVTNGSINLNIYAGKIQVGFGYTGRMVTQNISLGQGTDSKPRNIKHIYARFLNTIGCQIGPDSYICPQVVNNKANQIPDRPPAPFTGMLRLRQLDKWQDSMKRATVLHTDPTPCTILALEFEGYVTDPP
ncbi:MAG TPA: hypothetical protein V6D22_13665 [Candidatus Obscuribacterales bacterium]